jgi:hypothetical protein
MSEVMRVNPLHLQMFDTAERSGRVHALAKSICDLINDSVKDVHAPFAGPDVAQARIARRGFAAERLELAVAGIRRLQGLLAES